jgi:hypothetical protein
MPFAGKDNLYPGKANMSDKIFLDADILIYRFRGTKPMVLTMIAVFFIRLMVNQGLRSLTSRIEYPIAL